MGRGVERRGNGEQTNVEVIRFSCSNQASVTSNKHLFTFHQITISWFSDQDVIAVLLAPRNAGRRVARRPACECRVLALLNGHIN